ncbi:MAG: carboxypeptidase regulatory-like domain-containing protein [Acidobacteria bacterium]|nr:carboxypeptidase regulatory-like domain-containing protein [Acidobacteriota bacterium]
MIRQRTLSLAALLLLTSTSVLRAQATQQGGLTNQPAKISGKVLRADNGLPIRKATVNLVLIGVPGRGDSQFAQTDVTGKFEFSELQPGRYSMTVTKPGFVTRGMGPRRGGPGAFGGARPGTGQGVVTLASGENQTGINIKLDPAGIISGTVADIDGDPVPFVQVRAERLRFMPGGRKQLVMSSNTTTDDLGNYRLHTLQPGKYFVSARRDVPGGPVYLPTYYPNAASSDHSSPIEVRPGGEARRTDITFRTGATYSITGTVIDSTTGQPPQNYFVGYTGGGGMLGGAGAPQPDGSFRIRNVPPGHYSVFAMDNSGVGAGRASKPVDVVSTDVQVSIELGATGKLKGKIRMEDGSIVSAERMNFFLSPMENSGDFVRGGGGNGLENADASGNFELIGVTEGDFFLTVNGVRPPSYVKEVRVGGQNLGDGPIHFGLGQNIESCEVIVASDAAEISGTATDKDGQPGFGATVVLIPTEEKRRISGRLYRTTTVDATGQFRLTGVVPGNYVVFAWDDFEEGGQYDPEVLQRNGAQSIKITADPSGKHALELKVTTPR